MLSQLGTLSAVQLAVYVILAPPAFYVLIKHGKHGFLGWWFLATFCAIRIVGSVMEININVTGNQSTLQATEIILGLGLSSLFLAFVGILHESNHYLPFPKSPFLRLPFSLGLHFWIGAAIALIIVAYVGTGSTSTDDALLRVGSILFVLIWLAYCTFLLMSWRNFGRRSWASKRLLQVTTVLTPLLLLRIIYLVIYAFRPGTSNIFALRVILTLLMEFGMTIGFVVVGILTRHIALEENEMTGASDGGVMVDHRRGEISRSGMGGQGQGHEHGHDHGHGHGKSLSDGSVAVEMPVQAGANGHGYF